MRTRLVYSTLLVLVLGPALAGTANAEIVGWWRFDKGSGETAHDSSGYGNDVLFHGDPQWVAGYFGGGVAFDGSGDYLDCGVYAPSLDIVGELTVTAWIQPGVTLRDHKICGNITMGPNGGGYMMAIYSNDRVELEVRSSAGTSAPPNRPGGGVALQAGTWYFLAATYSETPEGSLIRTYVDAVPDQELTSTIVMSRSAETFKIGRHPNAPGAGEFTGVMDDVRVYNHVLTENELQEVMLGKGLQSKIACSPRPEDEQVDAPRDVVLGWTPGVYGQKHDVYFGAVFEDVNNADRINRLGVLVKEGQDANTYDPGILDFGQTYYWRIDDINTADSTINRGNVWSFEVEPFVYPIPFESITATASSSDGASAGPAGTVDGSGLVNGLHSIDTKTMWLSALGDPGPVWIQYDFDKPYKLHQMLIWNYNGPFILTGYALKDVTVEYSEDGDTWTVLPDAHEFARGPGTDGYACNTTIDFGDVVARSVRITAGSNWGGPIFGQYGLSEVRCLYVPVRARYPSPESGAKNVPVNATLRWRAGREGAQHDLYMDPDEQAVIDSSAFVAAPDQTHYGPLSLDLGTTYYWKINEVNLAETPTTLEGDVWNFSTAPYVVVDDFESYNDDVEAGTTIFDTWIDGLTNNTGSTVGYWTAPFAEQTIVHSGRQSMPLFYDNTGGAAYSEAELPLQSEDWTRAGIKSLVLHFHGDPANRAEQLYVKINGAKVLYQGAAVNLTRPRWICWSIDLASLGTNLKKVTSLVIGVGDGAAGGAGVVYIDDIRLYASAPAAALEEIWIEAEAASTISVPLEILFNVDGASGGQCIQAALNTPFATANPPAQGIATYPFTVQGGTYVIRARIAIPAANQDGFWFRIQGATADRALHASGWCQWNMVAPGAGWHWDDVHSSQSSPPNQTVNWTMSAGTYTLQIAYMDAGATPPMLDALVIVRVD